MDLLLVEDKDSFRRLLMQALEGSAWSVRAVADPQEALRVLAAAPAHVLVTDLRLPGMSGLELIRRARRLHPTLRVVLMSAFGEPKDIVEAMRLGADDFLPKPFDLDAFLALLDRLWALAGAPPPDPAEPWIAHSAPMRALDEALGRAAGTDLPVLFRGERGAGKGRCARRLHTLRHPGAPYLCVAAATLGADGPDPAALRLVQGGSLYLAGLEHLAPEAAAPLAHAMDAAGSGIHWMAGLEAGAALAPGLAQRLGALELNVPPLRERREDLLALARALLEADARRVGRTTPWLERAAERQLLEQSWPGNGRDLQALLARSLAHAEGAVIRAFPDLGADGAEPMSLPWPAPGPLEAMVRVAARVAEGQLLRRALAQAGGDLPRAAEGLGLSVRSLGQRLRDQGIPLEDDGGSSLPRKAT